MKKWMIITISLCFSILSCEKVENENFVGIENISFDNYPKVDGSTSARALNVMIACKLLGVHHSWQGLKITDPWGVSLISEWTVTPKTKDIPKQYGEDFFSKRIMTSQTHGAFINLIDGNADIHAYTRPRNSGSEEVFLEVVMDGLEPADFSEILTIIDMPVVLINSLIDEDLICYTFNNYAEVIVRMPNVPKIAINGIFPTKNTVKNSTYPFIAKVYVAIRSDLDHNSMAYKLYEWLQTENAKPAITECGFLTK